MLKCIPRCSYRSYRSYRSYPSFRITPILISLNTSTINHHTHISSLTQDHYFLSTPSTNPLNAEGLFTIPSSVDSERIPCFATSCTQSSQSRNKILFGPWHTKRGVR